MHPMSGYCPNTSRINALPLKLRESLLLTGSMKALHLQRKLRPSVLIKMFKMSEEVPV